MPVLNGKTVADAYPIAGQQGAILADVWNSRGGWFSVLGATAYVRLQYGDRGEEHWTDEILLGNGAFVVLPADCHGVQFRNGVSGLIATVTAQIAQGDEPPLAISTIGSVTLSVASLNFQHNDLAVATEPTLDFEDAAGVLTWSVVDDPPNTRIKLTPAFASPAIFPGVVESTHGSQAIGGDGTHPGWVLQETAIAGLFASVSVNSGNVFLTSSVAGDASDYRFTMTASGSIQWGPGSGARDCTLSRSGVGALRMTSTALTVDNGLTTFQPTNANVLSNFLLSSDTQPAFKIFAQGAIEWGPGGSSALDLELARLVNSPTGTGTFLELIVGSGFGYGTGTGGSGTVTQANAGTGVTINKPTGQVTITSVSLANGAAFTLKIADSVVGIDDVIVATVEGADSGTVVTGTGIPSAGNINITFHNISGATISSNLLVNFAVIKGAVA